MAKHERRDRGKERYWREVLGRWRRSGLSVRAFCERQGLSEASLYGWRREIDLRDREAGAAASAAAGAAGQLFVPVRIQGAVDDAIVIVLDGGRQVRVRPGFDGQTLQRVLAVLDAQTGTQGKRAEGKPC